MSTVDIKTAEWLEDIEIRAEYGSTTLKYDVAAILIAARKMKGLTQAALASIAGVSQAYIAKLESGEANPTIGRIGAILASIWLKSQINLTPLIAAERREDVPSASSSVGSQESWTGEMPTANDIQYPRISYVPAFEQLHATSYFSPSEPRGMLNAAS